MTIVLTATITPCVNQPYLAVNNPLIRLEQYKSALEFYIGCHEVSNIILCDNSNSINSDFSKEKEKAKAFRKKLEILYIHTNEYMISQYGKVMAKLKYWIM